MVMTEFWERNFREKREMWGLVPTQSAQLTAAMFADKGIKNVLIPGIGYGRNAQPFLSNGMGIAGIEISETAIALAAKHLGAGANIHHGSVTGMPFDDTLYDGIFSHALIHLLDEQERAAFIKSCYDQLTDNGCMVMTAIAKKAPSYGRGTLLSPDRYEQHGGAKIFFYDEASIYREFGSYGLTGISEVMENHPLYMITCNKGAQVSTLHTSKRLG